MTKPKMIRLIGTLFVVAAVIGGLQQQSRIRLQKSRISTLEHEIAMKDLVLEDQKARLLEFEEAKEAEQASVKTKAFLEWYNKDMRFY